MGVFCWVEEVVGKLIVLGGWIDFPQAKTLRFWQRGMKAKFCPAEGCGIFGT